MVKFALRAPELAAWIWVLNSFLRKEDFAKIFPQSDFIL